MQSQQFSLQDNLYYNEMKMMMMSTLYKTNMFSLIFIMLQPNSLTRQSAGRIMAHLRNIMIQSEQVLPQHPDAAQLAEKQQVSVPISQSQSLV